VRSAPHTCPSVRPPGPACRGPRSGGAALGRHALRAPR
jgi:hypothetical protein